MTGKEIYKIWAPYKKKWVDWVRPVPFVDMDVEKELHGFIDYDIEPTPYIKKIDKNAAYVIDIDGVNSVKEGIALAHLGYRPIPLFNGTSPNVGADSTMDNEIIEPMLIWGAFELNELEIKDDAPPAFLLDKNRMNRYKYSRGEFDNSWDIYAQDMPSGEYLIKNKIKRVIVRSDILRNDLCQILFKYQEKGLDIYFTNGYDEPRRVTIKKSKLRTN